MSSAQQQRVAAPRPGELEAEFEQEDENIFLVDKLQEFGVNNGDIQKLKAGGIHTIQGIKCTTIKKLTDIKGLSEAKVTKIREATGKLIPNGFVSAIEVEKQREAIDRITTGSSQLDKLLQGSADRGGFETRSITQVVGASQSGKTQICHTLCVTTQLPTELGGANGRVCYLDTENNFRPERLRSIAERFGIEDADQVVENVVHARACTSDHQMELLAMIPGLFAQAHSEGNDFKLLIIDSVMALYRIDFQGRGELADRQQKLGLFLSHCTHIAEQFNCAVVLTNQVTADPGAAAMFVQDAKKPIGGHVLSHASTTILNVKKGRGQQRIMKIMDSPCLAEGEAVYQLTEGDSQRNQLS